jgi:hypothetical protein
LKPHTVFKNTYSCPLKTLASKNINRTTKIKLEVTDIEGHKIVWFFTECRREILNEIGMYMDY